MLTAISIRTYKPKNGKGKVNFVYHVKGTPEELKQYQAVQGQYYREDETPAGAIPVWFSSKFVGESTKLIITKGDTPKVVADTSEFDKAKSIVEQYGGNLGDALATAYTAKLMGNMPAVPVTKQAEPAPEEQ